MLQLEIPALARDMDDFAALQDHLATTPEGGAAILVYALLSYVAGDPPADKYVAAALDAGQLQSGALRVMDRQRL